MKKIIFPFIVAASILIATSAQAQLRVNVNLNIGSQPAWGPVGYDHVDYYYLPDIEVYYNVPEQQYYFQEGNNWKHAAALPARYRNADIYNMHKVVLNNVDRPYLRNTTYSKQYASFKGRHDQAPIRDSKDERYFESRFHPQHDKWEKSHSRNDNKNNNNRNNNKNRH